MRFGLVTVRQYLKLAQVPNGAAVGVMAAVASLAGCGSEVSEGSPAAKSGVVTTSAERDVSAGLDQATDASISLLADWQSVADEIARGLEAAVNTQDDENFTKVLDLLDQADEHGLVFPGEEGDAVLPKWRDRIVSAGAERFIATTLDAWAKDLDPPEGLKKANELPVADIQYLAKADGIMAGGVRSAAKKVVDKLGALEWAQERRQVLAFGDDGIAGGAGLSLDERLAIGHGQRGSLNSQILQLAVAQREAAPTEIAVEIKKQLDERVRLREAVDEILKRLEGQQMQARRSYQRDALARIERVKPWISTREGAVNLENHVRELWQSNDPEQWKNAKPAARLYHRHKVVASFIAKQQIDFLQKSGQSHHDVGSYMKLCAGDPASDETLREVLAFVANSLDSTYIPYKAGPIWKEQARKHFVALFQEELTPVDVRLLDRPVAEVFNAIYDEAWKQLSEAEKLEVAKDVVTRPKNKLEGFLKAGGK